MVAQISVRIFVLYAGDSSTKEAEEMLYNLPEFTLVIVDSDDWKNRIETVHRGAIEKFQRYSFEKNPGHLNRMHIVNLMSSLPEGYEIKKDDNNIANAPSFNVLSEDFVSQFELVDNFIKRVVGFSILHEGIVVAEAKSFSVFDSGSRLKLLHNQNYDGEYDGTKSRC
ncbi:GNAT family N-acetyltransferase [Sporosarcina sp. D27]|uniref:GNAT family N-acetyltransferase n=1 Tax=Sporosarcina sp. D27 TaxID=1382305 RepID=UPI0004BB9B77|nr:GNAT family N-acetyltransferase [Sporosarcina sp. D27]